MSEKECAICAAGQSQDPGVGVHEIPRDRARDGIDHEWRTVYACAECYAVLSPAEWEPES